MHGLFFLQKSRFIIDICRKQRIIIGISQKPKEDGAMPRPKKCRRICALPRCDSFGPLAGDAAEEIEMSLDEFEAVRLIDLLGCSQEECAAQMGVARTTAQAVYNSARQKLAAVLVRGGRLCKLDEKDEAALKSLRPDAGIPEWGFRFLQGIPGVTMVLSGMSSTQQMQENVRTFEACKPLNDQEICALMTIADGMKNSVPCTACRYCTDHCPMGLDIPLMMATCSELRFSPVINIAMRLEGLPADKQPSACIGCGACAQMCPQKIDIPGVMAELNETLSKIPKWVDICKQREEAAKKAIQGE